MTAGKRDGRGRPDVQPAPVWGREKIVIRMPAAPPALRDAGLVAARAGVGYIFAAHGWQKLDSGLDATTAGMAKVGVPFPRASAIFATAVELGGGIAMMLGAATAIAGVLLAAVMVGAVWFVHYDQGPFVKDGGWELVVALGTASLLLAAIGPGRLSVDHVVRRLARRREVVVGNAATLPAGAPGAGSVVDVREERAPSRR
jgi:putative oxidoreductase